jgi:hypothetical protein
VRIAITVLAYLGSVLVVGAVTAFVVLVLAGPHSGLLPEPLEVAVGALGWLVVVALPIVAARSVWRRLGDRVSRAGST